MEKGKVEMNKTFKQFLIYDELESIVGQDNITDLECDLDSYSLDIWWPSRVWIIEGCKPPRPDFIVFPETTKQVSEVVKFANQNDIPIIPRGGGAGGLGGVLAFDGGIVIDMKKMNRIVDIDERAITSQLKQALCRLIWKPI